MWFISLVVSFAFVLASVAAVFVLSRTKHRGVLAANNIVLVGVFLGAFCLFLPIYSGTFSGEGGWSGGIKTVLMALHHVIRLFIVDCDFSDMEAVAGYMDEGLARVFTTYAAALYLCAPLLTFGFILSFFQNVVSYQRYLLGFFRDAYVFSELNERSVTLAQSILKKNRKRLVVFTDAFPSNEETSYELVNRARELGAVCFKKDILTVHFRLHRASSHLSFFVMGGQEAENMEQSLGLIAAYGQRENTTLYVFSTSVESELLLTAADKGKLHVRRIDEVRSLVYYTLHDTGKRLFDEATAAGDGEKQISAVILGAGKYGREMVKALVWFCQMEGYRVRLDVFDKDPMAGTKFTAACPELMDEKYNGVYVDGEAQYRIEFHDGFDPATAEFAQELRKQTDTTYAFVALGNEEENIQTAVTLRMYFERMGIRPRIQAVVSTARKREVLSAIRNYRGQPYAIDFIGDVQSLYSEAVIMDSALERDALARHLKWGKEEEFWAYEYNYRSSMAAAIHWSLRIALGFPGAGKREADLTDQERAALESLEHRRWNAYMRSEGYVYSGSHDKKSRNDLAKTHHDLVDYGSLSEEEKRKDSQVGTR